LHRAKFAKKGKNSQDEFEGLKPVTSENGFLVFFRFRFLLKNKGHSWRALRLGGSIIFF
jgi:hypothetical protein